MQKNGLSVGAPAGIIAWLMMSATYGLAQNESSDRSVQSGALEEVVVTARRREETIQDAPVSIRAMSAAQLDRFGISDLEGISAASPEFSVARAFSGSGAQLTIRGVGSASTSIGIEQSVAVIVDDAYYGQGRVINEGMFDLGRVELLKGPQALFFGKNATAGVVSLTTADPTDEFEVLARAGYEFTAEEMSSEFVISGPLSDRVGARLALRASHMFGGYFKNRAEAQAYNTTEFPLAFFLTPLDDPSATPRVAPPGEKNTPQEREFLGRFTLTFDPTDRLSTKLKFSASRTHNNNPAATVVLYNCHEGRSFTNPNVPCEDDKFNIYQNQFPAEVAATMPHAKSDGRLFNDYRSWQATATLEYELDRYIVTSVTNYQHNRNIWASDPDNASNANELATYATEFTPYDAFSQEFRVLTDFDGPFDVMGGLLYQRTEREFDQFLACAAAQDSSAEPQNRLLCLTKSSETEGETISPYLQAMWYVTPSIELSVGARYTYETKDSTFVHPYVHRDFQLPGAAVWREGEVASGKQTFKEWSPEATINWAATDELMFYAAYKTAYKSGGFSISGIFAAEGSVEDFLFEPETAQGFEAGVKSTLLGGRLRLNATTYFYEFDDYQVDFFNAPVFGFTTLNAGSVETKGIEIDSDYALGALPGVTLRGALNYNKAEYKDFIGPCWTGQKPSEGCDTSVPGVAFPGQDLGGMTTSMAPEWTAALGVDYTRELPGDMNLGFSLKAQYIDDYNPSHFANPNAVRDSYTKFDATIRVSGPGDRWELALLGKNLTNELIINGVWDAPNSGAGTGTEEGIQADQAGFADLPRTVALRLTARF